MEDNDDYFKNGGYAIINLYKLQWWNSLIMGWERDNVLKLKQRSYVKWLKTLIS